jgi:hypothetical protein
MYVEIVFPCVSFLLARFAPGRGDFRPGSIRNHSTHNPKLFHEPAVREALNFFGYNGFANLFTN